MRRQMTPQLLLMSLLGMLTLGSSAPARAAVLQLAWDHCLGDGGTPLRAFSCATNTGASPMVVSFVLDAPLDDVRVVDYALEMHSSSGQPVPVWWQLQTGCRAGSISVVGALPLPSVECPDWAPSALSGAVLSHYNFQLPSPDRARIGALTTVAIPVGPFHGVSLAAGTEYLGLRVLVGHANSTGSTACGGCLEPMVWALTGASFGSTVTLLNLTGTPGRSAVAWQGQLPTPARNRTWAEVKALYH